MADNLDVTPGTGATVAADKVGGALHQRVKPTWGDDGVGHDVTDSTPLPTSRPRNLSVYEGTISGSGNTTVISPATPGNAIRIHWVYAMPNPLSTSFPVIRIGFNDGAGGTSIDTGKGKYRAYGISKERIFEGAADEKVIINLSEAGTVPVTIHYQEFTP